MSATPQEKIQKGFHPLTPGFKFATLNDLKSFSDLVDSGTAAILVESIQGEGGINACTPAFLQGLRRLCDRNNLLLLIDEVQTGIGRTGRFFGFEHAGIRPDGIGMAKGLGGGFPIGAMWVGETSADLFHPGNHGTTFGGTPLACAAALAVLDVLEREELLAHVRTTSVPWNNSLGQLAGDFPKRVLGLRGQGFLVGLQMAGDPAAIHTALRQAGLLTAIAGGNVIRLLPPLTATDRELGRSVEIFRSVLGAKG
jgi:acetylornithine aminotransferase/acetylornithine/N-succinyldiaminopimelate aminotransferase